MNESAQNKLKRFGPEVLNESVPIEKKLSRVFQLKLGCELLWNVENFDVSNLAMIFPIMENNDESRSHLL